MHFLWDSVVCCIENKNKKTGEKNAISAGTKVISTAVHSFCEVFQCVCVCVYACVLFLNVYCVFVCGCVKMPSLTVAHKLKAYV